MKSINIILSSFLRKTLTLAVAVSAFGLAGATALAEDYSFKVHNKTDSKIVKVMVSETGKKYAEFDIGKGIAPGKSVTLVWAEHTKDQACKQYVKAVYADGSESKPAKFDFCEEDLEIEFEE